MSLNDFDGKDPIGATELVVEDNTALNDSLSEQEQVGIQQGNSSDYKIVQHISEDLTLLAQPLNHESADSYSTTEAHKEGEQLLNKLTKDDEEKDTLAVDNFTFQESKGKDFPSLHLTEINAFTEKEQILILEPAEIEAINNDTESYTNFEKTVANANISCQKGEQEMETNPKQTHLNASADKKIENRHDITNTEDIKSTTIDIVVKTARTVSSRTEKVTTQSLPSAKKIISPKSSKSCGPKLFKRAGATNSMQIIGNNPSKPKPRPLKSYADAFPSLSARKTAFKPPFLNSTTSTNSSSIAGSKMNGVDMPLSLKSGPKASTQLKGNMNTPPIVSRGLYEFKQQNIVRIMTAVPKSMSNKK